MPKRPHRASRMILTVTAIMALAAACGSHDPMPLDTGAPTTAGSQGTAPPEMAQAPDVPAQGAGSTIGGRRSLPGSTVTTGEVPTSAPTSTNRVDPTSSSSPATVKPDVPADIAPFCTRFLAFLKEIDTMEEGGDMLAALKAGFRDLKAIAPPPIQADWTTVNDLVQSMTDLDAPPPGAEQYDVVFERIGTWVKANCGFDPDDI